jgi:preprotein translocase SecE subunit
MKTNPSRSDASARSGSPRPPANRSGPARSAATRAAARVNARDYVQGVIAEMRRVTWPSREEWVGATLLTLALVVGVGVFTYLADLLFGWIFSFLTGGSR